MIEQEQIQLLGPQVFNFPNQGVMFFNKTTTYYQVKVADAVWESGMKSQEQEKPDFDPHVLLINLGISLPDEQKSITGDFELYLYFTRVDVDFALDNPELFIEKPLDKDLLEKELKFAIWKGDHWDTDFLKDPTIVLFEDLATFGHIDNESTINLLKSPYNLPYIGYAVFELDSWDDPTIAVGK